MKKSFAASLAVLLVPAALAAQVVPTAELSASLEASAAPAVTGLPAAAFAAPSLSAPAALSAAPPAAPAAPETPLPVPAAAPVAAAPAIAAPAAAPAATFPSAPAAASAIAPDESRGGASALEALREAAASRHGRRAGRGGGVFDGSRGRAATPRDAVFVVNDEGVRITGRAASYYGEVRRMVDQYQDKINLSESLDVMDDSYGDVLAKLSAVEALAKGRGLDRENTHLEETLMWVDGVLRDGKQSVAVHTHRVFFHHAKNPESEIREGIRRVDGYIREAEERFAPGGLAEQHLGRLDGVELVFDARGYQAIKDHLKKRAAEVAARTGGRIRFRNLDELAPMPKGQDEIRAKLNGLVKRYNGDGLSKIIEGVIYSRYVGLLLELKTVEHYHNLGYKILQSGRELFDKNGQYVSELDAVVQSPEGKTVLVEAKSARVPLPFEDILKDKVLYKLETYKKFKPQLDAMIGRPFDEVVFSMDVGMAEGDQVREDKRGEPNQDDVRKVELMSWLHAQEPELSKRYGFPVRFLFLHSAPARQAAGAR